MVLIVQYTHTSVPTWQHTIYKYMPCDNFAASLRQSVSQSVISRSRPALTPPPSLRRLAHLWELCSSSGKTGKKIFVNNHPLSQSQGSPRYRPGLNVCDVIDSICTSEKPVHLVPNLSMDN